MNGIPQLSLKPLVPLPAESSSATPLPPVADLSASSPVSPFSALFAAPSQPQPQPTSSSSSSPRPLFPTSPPRVGRRSANASGNATPLKPPEDSPSSPFGEFVTSDPLQDSSTAPSFSPVIGRAASDPFQQHDRHTPFMQEATLRTKERGAKVMSELVGRDDEDPLGWLAGPSIPQPASAKPFDDWDGMDSEIKDEELQREIHDHAVLPGTPRASRSTSPTGDASGDEEDVITLPSGKRGREKRDPHEMRASPIPISRPDSQPLQTGSQPPSSYLNFTLPRKWFSTSVRPSATLSSSLPPQAGITRQMSAGEFVTLPPADLSPFGSPEKSTPPVHMERPLDGPFAKRLFIPPTGAPSFRPDDNWNPSGFEYDTHSKKDTLGSESVNLTGRTPGTIPVLSTEAADFLRPKLPPLPRLAKSWSLLYSTDQHGISITTLYKNVENYYSQPGGCILAVREANDDDETEPKPACFGVWLGNGMRHNEGSYFGSGESFLWKTFPSPSGDTKVGGAKIFKWTGRNDYVALCESDYVSFGGGDGKYGLYVDSSFTDGTSERCDTFANDVLCESSPGQERARFECMALEVWRVPT